MRKDGIRKEGERRGAGKQPLVTTVDSGSEYHRQMSQEDIWICRKDWDYMIQE